MDWSYAQPVKISFGCGCINKLTEVINTLSGTKGILITSKFFVSSGIAQKVLESTQGLLTVVYADVSPNPEVSEVDACAEIIRSRKIDFIAAMGGGSVMDLAKAASGICLTTDSIVRFHGTGEKMPAAHLPLIAIPTTAGTGSEVTSVAVLSDRCSGRKAPIVSEGFYPAYALIDPELTYSLPPQLTAATGIDVLAHALEGFWSRGHQPVCDILAEQAARLVFAYLYRAYENGADKESRIKLAEASVIAGLAFNLPKTTASHACSFPLTNIYHIPHGEACGLTLDYFCRLNGSAENGRVDKLAVRLGFKNAAAMAEAIYELKAKMGLCTDLKKFQLSDAQIAELVKISRHANLYNNPVEVTDEMLLDMYNSLR